MFYWLIDLSNTVPGMGMFRTFLNVFRYLTFRTGGAMVTGALFVFLFGPWIIDHLRLRQGKGQPIRTDGPQSHLLTKIGTPTMGGLMILSGLVVSTLLWANPLNPYVWIVLAVTLGFGFVGFYDDYLKVTKQSHGGFSGSLRLALEALIARGRDGNGADIRISMFDVMADWLAVPLLNAEAGNPPQRMGLAHPSIAPYGVFRSWDGKDILISIQSEREWKKLCADVLEQPDLSSDPRFCNMVERVRNRQLTDKTVGESFAAMTRDELLKRLSEADIAFAEVNSMEDLAAHPHLRRIEVATPAGPVSYPAPAAIVVGAPRHYGAVPGIGEHTDSAKTSPARKQLS